MARKNVSDLRDEAAEAVERGKLGKAISLYEELEELEPANAAWSKRLGETHRRDGKTKQAVVAFERAAEKFMQSGFLVQAIAVCKLILQIEPENVTAIARLGELAPVPPPRPAPAPRPAPDPGEFSVDAIATSEEASLPVGAADIAALELDPSPPSRSPVVSEPALIIDVPVEPPPPPPRRTVSPTTIPPGSGIDALDLASVVPRSRKQLQQDGSESGIVILLLDDDDDDDDDNNEVALVPGEPPAAVSSPPDRPMLTPAARLALRKTPLFAELHPRVLETLIPRMALIELGAGEVLFREGESGTSLFVISEGEVVVESGENELARLGPGAFFGEVSLVTDLPRSATVRAVGQLELLAIDRELVRDAAAEQPELINILLRFVRDRLVDRMTQTSELFRPFADQDRKELSERFELVEIAQGSHLVVQGTRADGLYVMVAGRVDITRAESPKPITQLGSGDVFGEMSLLAGGGSTANVIAATRVLALRLPARTFSEVIMTHPQVLVFLGELADRRAPPPDSDVEFADLHLDLL